MVRNILETDFKNLEETIEVKVKKGISLEVDRHESQDNNDFDLLLWMITITE